MTMTVQAPTDVALQVSGVTKVFDSDEGRTAALHGVDLTVHRGEFVTLVGHSGCGKTTLLNIVAGLDTPTSGSVEVAVRTAFMFQDATLLPWLTARQNVELALKLRGVPRSQRKGQGDELLEVVRLTHAASRRPHELSGGMRQRVNLARCLAQNADLVLMDEPLGALDAMTRDLLHDEIERVVSERDLTVMFVTHNMREAVRLGDRAVLMAYGKIVLEQDIDLPHPRVMDSAAVAERAAYLTHRLHEAA